MSIFLFYYPAIYRDLKQYGWCFFPWMILILNLYGIGKVPCSTESISELQNRAHNTAMTSPSGFGDFDVWSGNATGTIPWLQSYCIPDQQITAIYNVTLNWYSRTSPIWLISSLVMFPNMSLLGPTIKCVFFNHFVVALLHGFLISSFIRSYLPFKEIICDS